MTDHDDQNPTAGFRRAEVEVPASPDQVWQAIATGAGNAAWMFPADIEPGEGGKIVIHREPFGRDAVATVTEWDPPHRFAYEEPVEAPGGSAGQPLATEILVEAREGGSCVVRVVSGFHDGEGWEDLVHGVIEGWRMALIVLRGYLTHFAGQPAARLDATVDLGRPPGDRVEVSTVLMGLLGLTGLTAGDQFTTPADVPHLAGAVEYASAGYVLLRVSEPYPALFAISCFPMDEPSVSVNVVGRLYGNVDPATATRDEARWRSWLSVRFAKP